uniref:Uncharacterized protein n=1 Tax=viral metagenome TaxID=1070528 RepID=A0A6M3L1U4_9ZZZZ
MRKEWLDKVDEVVKDVKESTDAYIKENIDPVAEIGNPEDILSKKYERWTPEDMQTLQQVYVYDIKPLEDFIAKKEIDKLWKSEEQTRMLEG